MQSHSTDSTGHELGGTIGIAVFGGDRGSRDWRDRRSRSLGAPLAPTRDAYALAPH